MGSRITRLGSIVVVAMLALPAVIRAQGVNWGVKGGIHSTSVERVPDYYDWVLCCHPFFPDAEVDSAAGAGGTAGLFVALPMGRGLSIQAEGSLSRKRHSVNLEPYEPIDVTFTRDVIETATLLKLERPLAPQHSFYALAGPVLGFRVGESEKSNDPRLSRGNPETDLYVTQILAYSAPELLRRSQFSVAVGAGWVYRRLLVEVRLTQGVQSMFKERDGLVDGFVEVGADEATVRGLVPQFAPFLEGAKGRDLALLMGFRF